MNAIDTSQSWFWTPEWQAMERQVDEELERGEYEDFDSIEELLSCSTEPPPGITQS